MKKDCIGCEIVMGNVLPPGGILYNDTYWTVNHVVGNPRPLLRGMLILQPKRHVEHIHELTIDEISASAPIIRNLCISVNKVLAPEKIYVCSFGEGVKHVHFVILPRSKEMPSNGARVLREVIEENKWACTKQEAIEVADKLKRELIKNSQQDA